MEEKYTFKVTDLIVDSLEEHGVRTEVKNFFGHHEIIYAKFAITCGPRALVSYICSENGNNVMICVSDFITRIMGEKKPRVFGICNLLNENLDYFKFTVDYDNEVKMEYKFPSEMEGEKIGSMAYKMFSYIERIFDSEYELFIKALYTDDELPDYVITPMFWDIYDILTKMEQESISDSYIFDIIVQNASSYMKTKIAVTLQNTIGQVFKETAKYLGVDENRDSLFINERAKMYTRKMNKTMEEFEILPNDVIKIEQRLYVL